MNKVISPLHAADLCQQSYKDFDELDGPVPYIEELGYNLLFSLQSNLELNTEGWFLRHGSEGYVVGVFPGSKGFEDWKNNFRLPRTADVPNLFQHFPALELWNGHSRGAQLAETIGLSLRQHQGNYYNLCQIERLAPPRTGDFTWTRYRNEVIGDIERSWALRYDPVLSLPTTRMGYRHAGVIQMLEGGGHSIGRYIDAMKMAGLC